MKRDGYGVSRLTNHESPITAPVIYTIGHGNRPIGEFVMLLEEAGVACLADVRAYPVSRRHPQFARPALESALGEAGIGYVWEGKALGGRRTLARVSPNNALRNPGLRAYADYMLTEAFRDAIERLIGRASSVRTAIMCAERLPSQCHRSLISDYLVARDVAVAHLVEADRREAHKLSPLVEVRGGMLHYHLGARARPLFPEPTC